MLGVLFHKRKFKKDNLKHSFVYAMEWKMIQRTRTQYEYARYKWSGFDRKLLLRTDSSSTTKSFSILYTTIAFNLFKNYEISMRNVILFYLNATTLKAKIPVDDIWHLVNRLFWMIWWEWNC